jgi:hypothetical protein
VLLTVTQENFRARNNDLTVGSDGLNIALVAATTDH